VSKGTRNVASCVSAWNGRNSRNATARGCFIPYHILEEPVSILKPEDLNNTFPLSFDAHDYNSAGNEPVGHRRKMNASPDHD
jgi:hypothetical protein